jgi:spermidine synthase
MSASEAQHDWGRRAPHLALLLGAFGQLGQLLVFREVMAACHGTEILFGIVLAGHLGWTAAGSAVAAVLLGGPSRPRVSLLVSLVSAAGPLLFGEILLARAMAGWGTSAAGQVVSVTHSALLALAVTGPVALVSGALFALALRCGQAGGFGPVYRAESWGAVLVGFAFTFGLVHLAGPVCTALVSGVVFTVAVALLAWPLPRTAGFLAAAGTALCLAVAWFPAEDWAERLRWRNILGDYELVDRCDSPYGRICALRRPGTRQVSIYHSGSRVVTLEPGSTASDARQLADLCATLHPEPHKALLIGNALGAFPEEFLRHGLDQVDALEFDPALFAFARPFAGGDRDSSSVRRIGADGRAFVASARIGSYDLIVVSAGEPDGATVNRYYTVEFFRHARRALAENGVLVVMLPTYGASPEYIGKDLARRAATVSRALVEVFGHSRAAPVDGFLLAAAKSRERLRLDAEILSERLSRRPNTQPTIQIETEGRVTSVPLSPADYFASLFGGVLAAQESLDGGQTQPYVDTLEDALRSASVPVNRDGCPVMVAESLAFGAAVAGVDPLARDARAAVSLADLLRTWGPRSVAVCLLASLGVACAAIVAPSIRGNPCRSEPALLLCAFATGLFGMAMTVALLGAYQNVRGYVYGEIGGISATFMAGLALGAYAGHTATRARARLVLLATVAAMILLCVVGAPAMAGLGQLPGTLLAAVGFWLLVLVAGVLDGATFPPLVTLGEAEGVSHFGGLVYAVDLLGAGLGALLCGTVWIPLFGVAAALLTAAGVLAASLLALLLAPPAKQ